MTFPTQYHPSAFQFAFPPGLPKVMISTAAPDQLVPTKHQVTPQEFISSKDFRHLDISEIAQKYAQSTRVSAQISAGDLCHVLDKQTTTRIQPFIEVTNCCYARLKKLAEYGLSACYFDVPLFVSGLPLYDVAACAEFISCHLSSNGFLIKRVSDRRMYIQWYRKYVTGGEARGDAPLKDLEDSKVSKDLKDSKLLKEQSGFNVLKDLDDGETKAKKIKKGQGRRLHAAREEPKTLSEDASLFKSIALLRPSGKFSLNLLDAV